MSRIKHVNYDHLAETYNQRFAQDDDGNRGTALLQLVRERAPSRVLEVGCGTGHWLRKIAPFVPNQMGIDLSHGMLSTGVLNKWNPNPAQADAAALPVKASAFDLVYCINAIHHFHDPQSYIREAYRALRPGGTLAVVTGEPSKRKEQWFIYEYFPGTFEFDLNRFYHFTKIEGWMSGAGFDLLERRVFAHIHDPKYGREVLDTPFLKKHACSQLAHLTDAAYAVGIKKIQDALDKAENLPHPIEFNTDMTLTMLLAKKP